MVRVEVADRSGSRAPQPRPAPPVMRNAAGGLFTYSGIEDKRIESYPSAVAAGSLKAWPTGSDARSSQASVLAVAGSGERDRGRHLGRC